MATHSSVLACLENPRDRGAWWAAISEVAQSRTRLKRLSIIISSSRGLSYSIACEILVPQPGMEPESPVLEGGFWTTGPPDKSLEPFILNLKDQDQVTSFHEWDLGTWELPIWLSRGAGYMSVSCLPAQQGLHSDSASLQNPKCLPLPLQGLSHLWPNLTALITNNPSKGHSPSIGKARATEQGVLDYSAIYTEVCDHVIKFLKEQDSSF